MCLGDMCAACCRNVVNIACPQLGHLWQHTASKQHCDFSGQSCEKCAVSHTFQATQVFFNFLYTGKAELAACSSSTGTGAESAFPNALLDLLICADKWFPDSKPHYLLMECEVALRGYVNVHNCLKILAVAAHHNAKQLKAYCIHSARTWRRGWLKQDEQALAAWEKTNTSLAEAFRQPL